MKGCGRVPAAARRRRRRSTASTPGRGLAPGQPAGSRPPPPEAPARPAPRPRVRHIPHATAPATTRHTSPPAASAVRTPKCSAIQPGLQRAERRQAEHHERVEPHDPAPQPVGRLELEHRVGRDAVQGHQAAGDGEQHQRRTRSPARAPRRSATSPNSTRGAEHQPRPPGAPAEAAMKSAAAAAPTPIAETSAP